MQSAETAYHVKDVGRILLEVQSQLKDIRSVIESTDSRQERQREVLIQSLDNVLRSAETDLRTKAELVLNASTQDSVNTLPSTGVRKPPPSPAQPAQPAPARSSSPARPSRVRQRVEDARRLQLLTDPNSEVSREYLRARYGIPHADRPALAAAEQERRVALARRRKATATGRIRPPRVTPNAGLGGLRDGGHTTASVRAEDLEQGMYNLVERGFVPPNADLTPAFTHGAAALRNARAVMHRPADRHARAEPHSDAVGFNVASLRLDASEPAPHEAAIIAGRVVRAGPPPPQRVPHMTTSELTPAVGPALSPPHGGARAGDVAAADGRRAADDDGDAAATPHPGDDGAAGASDAALRSAVDKIRGYNELLDAYSLHQFLIRRGRTLRATPEFQSFHRTHRADWGGISRIIRLLEDLFSRYAVPVVYVDGQHVAELAHAEVGRVSEADLLRCVANADEVSRYVRLPGQRFKGDRGRVDAATCIQAFRRMVAQRRQFRRQKRHQRRLGARRREEQERWDAAQGGFQRRWKEIRQKRRVAVHVPSLSWEQRVRASTPNLALRQAAQLQRLVAVADPLVDVVLVAPFPPSDEVLAYYRKLLTVGGVADPALRIKVVVPENADRFPPTFSLASLALYSPRCLRRIAALARGKEAYLVPGEVGPDDRRLALHLGLPLLGPDPQVAALYGSKSGAKRLFAEADVNMPPGAHDLYEEEEVVAALARLVARHPDVPRWLLKLDDEHGGRGTAYLETRHLPSVLALRRDRDKQSVQDPAYWQRGDVQDAARATLLPELQRVLPRRAVLACRDAYPDYAAFVRALCDVGGVVEACAQGVVGSPSANLFVAPDGRVSLTSTHDQVFDAPFRFAGAAFPQQSVPAAAMLGAASAVGAALYAKGVIGYVGVDFVAWEDEGAGSLRLWAVDVNLRVTHTAASFAMFNFLMGGRFDALTGAYHVLRDADQDADGASSAAGTPPARRARPETPFRFDGDAFASDDASDAASDMISSPALTGRSAASSTRASRTSSAAGGRPAFEPRHYVAFPYLTHSGLASLQYAAFFNQCRLRGISFDLRRRVGTAFLLIDSLVSGAIGCLCVGHTPIAALQNCANTLRFIESQIGARPPDGEFDIEPSNFADAHQTIRSMLKAAGLSSKPPAHQR